MKIAINYYGLPRTPQNARQIFDQYINDSAHEFHLMYTTWNVENTASVEQQFPGIFIRKEAVPSPQVLGNLLTNYALDESNILLQKSLRHFLLGIYIKDKSRLTVEAYETKMNITFDLVITIRLDTTIRDAHLGEFYNKLQLHEPIVYSAKDGHYDLYNEGTFPDCLLIGGRDFHLKLLQLLDALPNCTLRDGRTFHPETTSYKTVNYYGGRVEYLPFYSFVVPKK
jgi:hypothetical protein